MLNIYRPFLFLSNCNAEYIAFILYYVFNDGDDLKYEHPICNYDIKFKGDEHFYISISQGLDQYPMDTKEVHVCMCLCVHAEIHLYVYNFEVYKKHCVEKRIYLNLQHNSVLITQSSVNMCANRNF